MYYYGCLGLMGYMEIMEKKMETTIMGYIRFRCLGLMGKRRLSPSECLPSVAEGIEDGVAGILGLASLVCFSMLAPRF